MDTVWFGVKVFAMLITAAALAVLISVEARAHDSWISRGGYHNPVTNGWCCGDNDCHQLPAGDATEVRGGTMVKSRGEFVPEEETMPLSPDQHYWVCTRPDGTRRCFFSPAPTF